MTQHEHPVLYFFLNGGCYVALAAEALVMLGLIFVWCAPKRRKAYWRTKL